MSVARLEIYLDGLGRGGAEQLLLELLPELTRSFESVELIALPGPGDLEEELRALVPITRVSLVGAWRRLWRSSAICHVNLARPQMIASAVVILCRVLYRRPPRIVCHEHASFQYHTGRGGLRGFADAVYRRVVTFCLRRRLYRYVISTRARRAELVPVVPDAEEILVLPNSVGAERMRRLATCRDETVLASAFAERTYRLFTLSRLHPVKQLDWAIDAVAALARDRPDWTWVLTVNGLGPDEARLRDHASRYDGITNLSIDFAGFVESFEAAASSSHCFLFPSRSEGFPVGLTEAALTGVTAVSNDCPHGPADLSEFFPNIRLATPPTHERFVETVRAVVGSEIDSREYVHRHAPTGWPTSEDSAAALAEFLRASGSR